LKGVNEGKKKVEGAERGGPGGDLRTSPQSEKKQGISAGKGILPGGKRSPSQEKEKKLQGKGLIVPGNGTPRRGGWENLGGKGALRGGPSGEGLRSHSESNLFTGKEEEKILGREKGKGSN